MFVKMQTILRYSPRQSFAISLTWEVTKVYVSLIIRPVPSRSLVGSYELRCAFQLVESSRGTGDVHEEDCDHTLTDKLNTTAKKYIKNRRIRNGNISKDYIILQLSAPWILEEIDSKDYSLNTR